MDCPVCGVSNPTDQRFCGSCGTALAPDSHVREGRKTVTVLFADVSGSTALGERLDPELMRGLMGRYFTEIKRVIEGHGGTVEKFIGDAVMAVFGIPVVHEDDAVRAVRAAADIRDRLAQLNGELSATQGFAITFRTGLCTGEIVAGDPASGHTLVTGDAVNVAARLEQAAAPGEILIAASTWRLVRDAVEVAPVEPVSAKGKARPVPAYRLLSVSPGAAGYSRRPDTPLVGRERELQQLREVFERARRDRSPQLFTMFGTAGVGKSRMTAEFVASLATEARVLKGRCLPYGEGITYWPLREIVHEAAVIDDTDSVEQAKAKLLGLLDGAPEQQLLARRVGAAIGLETDGAPQEEIFWATRKLLEHLARQRPLVTVWEDIHWAEETCLDLLEYIIDLGADAPLLLLCPARSELLDSRPGWGANRSSSSALHLEPLAAEMSGLLIDELPGGSALPATVRERIVAVAEGNPLFLEEMLAMLVDEGHLVERDGVWLATDEVGQIAVPLSVKALLSARIDGLPNEERQVAERASIAGRVFEAAAIRELVDGDTTQVGRSLIALVRRELIRPERSDLTAGDAFKFRHLLIRDAAYDSLAKRDRAELHERFANWLERAAADRLGEYEEIVGYHLEQACRYRGELSETGADVTRLAERAGNTLWRAGRQALDNGDSAGSAGLLERAAGLLRDNTTMMQIEIDLGAAYVDMHEWERAQELFLKVIEGSPDTPASPLRLRAQLESLGIHCVTGAATDDDVVEVRRLVAALEVQGDDRVTASAYHWLSYVLYDRIAEANAAHERAVEYARRAGDVRQEQRIIFFGSHFYGPTPARKGLALYAPRLTSEASKIGQFDAWFGTAGFLAIVGETAEARTAFSRFVEMAADIGLKDSYWGEAEMRCAIELAADNPGAVLDLVDRTIARTLADGLPAATSHFAGQAARAAYRQGDYSLAERYARMSTQHDLGIAAIGSGVAATLLARSGRIAEGTGLMGRYLAYLDKTDRLGEIGDGYLEAAEMHWIADDGDAARKYANHARDMYLQKEHVVGERRAAALLATIDSA